MFNKILKIANDLEKFYMGMYKSSLVRENNEIDDFFMVITFSEIFGIENPYAIYTLDMLPVLMPRFHRWHHNVGLKHAFFESFPCSCCC